MNDNNRQYCAYYTRHMRVDFRDRIRRLAFDRSVGITRISQETIIDEALAIGLAIMESKKRVILLD